MVYVRIVFEDHRSYDALLADLMEAGTLGVTEGAGYLDAFFDDEAIAERKRAVEAEPLSLRSSLLYRRGATIQLRWGVSAWRSIPGCSVAPVSIRVPANVWRQWSGWSKEAIPCSMSVAVPASCRSQRFC